MCNRTFRLAPIAFGFVLALTMSGRLLADDQADQSSSMNNLKQLALAMHNFHEANRNLPAHASYKKKKPLLSWRVFLLPYLDEQKLFNEFHLDESWNSTHNKKLIAKMPNVFADPFGKVKKAGMTRYVVPVGANCIFTGKPEGIGFRDITDGTSLTLMTVEAAPDHAVMWSKPDDLKIDPKKPAKGLMVKGDKGFNAGFADGSVRFLSRENSTKTLSALFTRNGREVIGELQ